MVIENFSIYLNFYVIILLVSIILDKIFRFLFPPHCLACGRPGNFFCSSCQQKIKFLTNQICPVCGYPALGGKTHFSCQTRYSLDGLSSVFAYALPFSLAVKKVKYYPFVFAAIKELVSLTLPYLEEREDFLPLRCFLKKKPVLVPIPLSRSRFFWRGYNQAEIMAEILGEKWSLPVAKKALLRVKETAPQSFLSSNLRQKNIRGAFKVNDQWRRYVPKFPVLLVDDIWTTGATMRTAANVLKRAGIPQVWGLTFCR